MAILLFGSQIQGQPTFTPPSPEGSALIRSINIPVNHYTGTASINIPLYGVQSRDIQIPITLTYQASGNKVDDVATWVGLGWRLSAGGQITRMVRGKADESGYSKVQGPNDGLIASDMSLWKKSVFEKRDTTHFDGEPDIFYFEVPGHSGSFVVDYDGGIHTIPSQNVRIEWLNKKYYGLNNSEFLITDDAGNRYYFKEREYTHSSIKNGTDDPTQERFCSSWLLTKIVSNRGDCVTLEYETGQEYSYTIRNILTLINAHREGLDPFTPTVKYDSIKDKTNTITFREPKYLSKISWNNGHVEFISTNDRQDLAGGRRLNEIKIFNNDSFLKSYKLGYGNFSNKNLQLFRIDETDGVKTDLVCNFFYEQEYVLPARNTPSFDHFGYYNRSELGGGDYPSLSIMTDRIPGRNYAPKWPYTKADILTEIRYKGGGRKTFEYEANDYYEVNTHWDYETNAITHTGSWAGVRIKSISEYADENVIPYTTEYRYEKKLDDTHTVSSGEIYQHTILYADRSLSDDVFNTQSGNYNIDFYVSNKNHNYIYDVNGSAIVYSQVTEILPNKSSNIYYFTSFKDPICKDYPAKIYYVEDSKASLQEYFLGDNILVPRSSQAWKRGLLTAQEGYDADGRLISRQRNHYKLDAPSKKKVLGYAMTSGNYSRLSLNAHLILGVYEWDIQPLYLDSTIVEKGPYNLFSSTAYSYDTTYFGVKEVVNRDVEGNRYKTVMRYPYDYTGISPTTTDPMGQALNIMRQKNIVNVPVETIHYKNDLVTGAELNTFKLNNPADSTIVGHESRALPLKEPVSWNQPESAENFMPSQIQGTGAMTVDPRYELGAIHEVYDPQNNLIYTRDAYGRNKTFLYGYNHSLPIAEIQNAVGGAPYSSEQNRNYSYSGNSSPLSCGNIEVAMAQDIEFTVNLSIQDTICDNYPADVYPAALNVTGSGGSYSATLLSTTGRESNFVLSYKIHLNPGSYSPQFVVQSAPGYGLWSATVSYAVHEGETTSSRSGQVFHTSFEDPDEGVKVSLAKTGGKVHQGSYQIDLRPFLEGRYRLTYWQSADQGNSWEMADAMITVSNTSTSYSINPGSHWIDEVRVFPAGATMTTYTYLPGVGMTSKMDTNGKAIYYEYDGFGRLSAIRDNDRNLVESYEYK